jgi:hypothetical protein
MPTKVLSLLLSSGVFSPMAAAGPGVEALDDCSEAGAERPEDDEAMILRRVWVHKGRREGYKSVLVGLHCVGQGCEPQSQLSRGLKTRTASINDVDLVSHTLAGERGKERPSKTTATLSQSQPLLQVMLLFLVLASSQILLSCSML